MDLRKVKKLIELLEESSIAEIEIHEGEESVRISRASRMVPAQTLVEMPQRTAAGAAAPPPAAAENAAVAAREDVVTAPMVGTFYAAAAPTNPAFVEVGQRVKNGDVLCIIEAMKIMNPIESDRDGIVHAVLVENGQPVEYGQPLFIVS
ncbi:MAG: acetyl-CoA carboxylase biotin carboxyl carrier protein [Gammaproteobacteria bacterium]|nr:acetyl-CoA carboxylase biotin carboxyl carrier protein [Gammaproteobacteria bacterium]